MKKAISLLLMIAMAFSLCACSKTVFESKNSSEGDTFETQKTSSNGVSEKLNLLCRKDDGGCYTEDGYYYLTEDTVELTNGVYATHLMYMDFKTQQEIYLCSNTGCNHNTADCSAVFLYDDFPSFSTLIFIYNNKLYILSKEMDTTGEISTDYLHINGNTNEQTQSENEPTVLYRANLDGTNREKVYTFDPSVTLEDFVVGDEKGLYFITKKLSTEQHGTSTYSTSSEKNLVYLDVDKKEEKTIYSMDFDDNIDWNVQSCFNQYLVLTGIDFGKKLSFEEYDDNTYKSLYNQSDEVIATFSLKDGKLNEVFRMKNKNFPSYKIEENMMYYSNSDEKVIKSVDLNTGTEKEICTLKQNFISHIIANYLCCESLDSANDCTLYFVDINTGKISHSRLVNKSLGWTLEIRAVLKSDVLVIYDYDAKASGDGSYEINRYQYGLISQEDLVNGNDNYRKIEMIGVGK